MYPVSLSRAAVVFEADHFFYTEALVLFDNARPVKNDLENSEAATLGEKKKKSNCKIHVSCYDDTSEWMFPGYF